MSRKTFLFEIMGLILTVAPLFSENKADNICTVKGIAIDSTSTETIPYVTVSISKASTPDVYLKRIAGNNSGVFEIVVNNTGDYMLTLESVGMHKKIVNITVVASQKKMELGKITLSTSGTMLNEVTVNATKPLVKVDLDKISYDTKSDPESESLTVLDMLKKVPLVTVDGDDKIQLK